MMGKIITMPKIGEISIPANSEKNYSDTSMCLGM